MAFHLTPSKRPFEHNPLEPNGRGKWHKMAPGAGRQGHLKVQLGTVVFRVLCPASKSGGLIGKGGGVVSKIRKETGAKVKLEGTVPGCDERVVAITGSEKDAKVGNDQSKENAAATAAAADGNNDKDNTEAENTEKENDEKNEEKEDSSTVVASKVDKASSSALKALLLVFERIVADEEEKTDGGDEAGENSSVSFRILVPSYQVGCVLGKGGSLMKQMSVDSRSQIQMLPRDKLPSCASPQEEIVQITGGIESVRKALNLVAQQLLENPLRDHDSFASTNPSGSSSHSFASIPRPEGLMMANYHGSMQGPPFPSRPYDIADYRPNIPPPFPNFHEGVAPLPPQVPPEMLTLRLLCSNDKVGSVIGKGGNVIRNLQHETGCEIKVLETTPESEDRIVAISGPSHPSDGISPAQNAVILVQRKIATSASDNKRSHVISRLLVGSNQTGCLLGKGGTVIAEMRKLSGAHIRILTKEQIPTAVPENDEVVQITGDFEAVREALMQITTRLKHHLFRDKVPPMNPNMHPAFGEVEPPFGPYIGRHESAPSRLFSNLPSFQRDPVGRPFEERAGFPHKMPGSGVPHGADRSAPWAPPQGVRDSGGPMPVPGFPLPQRRVDGFSGASRPTVVPSITVDAVVPRSLVPSLYGEDGGCLRRIREISEAKITITEPRPEATETVILISGMPEQTHAAQSLLQAFVLSESGAA